MRLTKVGLGGQNMSYQRPQNDRPLSKAEKLQLLKANALHYQMLASTDPSALNRKLPRDALSELLSRIGEIVVDESRTLAAPASPGLIRDFLDANPLPHTMAPLLSDSFRVFCLMLNALKQWVVAEQSAADRYLLGGKARQLCREAVETCVVTGDRIASEVELHHPVRDGRPPIPLSKKGHAVLEGQTSTVGDDAMEQALGALRRQKNRSWAHLRRGCLDLLGRPEPWESKGSAANARAFARRAAEATNTSYAGILAWLEKRGVC
jgi:hypothetical protein